MKHKAIFICGTDTGVGKTLVTGSLLSFLNQKGIRAGGFKPLESGCAPVKGMKRHLKRADAEFLKKMGEMEEPLDWINPYYFKEPLAPGIAAQREGKRISFSHIKKSLNRLQKKYDLILVEGAGGLLVPVQGLKTNLDLIQFLKLPVVVVSRLGLGTINHTLLTLEHLKKNHILILGVILNQTEPTKNLASQTNPSILKKYKVPLLGIVPYKQSFKNEVVMLGIPQIAHKFI